jgi:rare lipoprotein A
LRKHTPFAAAPAAGIPTVTTDASVGIASFYKFNSRTASGEQFNPSELTAAHRTLPFGTRLRVTNLGTGQSVTVRINDRGPFIPGRVIDVSHSAAETLGMTESGIAKVKLEVEK